MRTILIVTSVLAIAACKQAEAPPAPEATAAATAAAAEAAPQAMPGTYEVTQSDGTKHTTVIKADGTYEDKDASGKVLVTGTWKVADGKSCFDPEGDTPEGCFVDSPPAADGTFTATPDKGDPITVKKTG